LVVWIQLWGFWKTLKKEGDNWCISTCCIVKFILIENIIIILLQNYYFPQKVIYSSLLIHNFLLVIFNFLFILPERVLSIITKKELFYF
jgi:hypothetical protein